MKRWMTSSTVVKRKGVGFFPPVHMHDQGRTVSTPTTASFSRPCIVDDDSHDAGAPGHPAPLFPINMY
jgi:hypothetical protein